MIIEFPHLGNIESYRVLRVLGFLAILCLDALKVWWELEIQFGSENLELFSMSVKGLTIFGLVLAKERIRLLLIELGGLRC